MVADVSCRFQDILIFLFSLKSQHFFIFINIHLSCACREKDGQRRGDMTVKMILIISYSFLFHDMEIHSIHRASVTV